MYQYTTQLAKGLGQALGGGFAGLTKSLDDFGAGVVRYFSFKLKTTIVMHEKNALQML
jgi:hypothetical protein